jgi:hypothetical protein
MFARICPSPPQAALAIDVVRLDRLERLAPGATSVPASIELADAPSP